MTVTRTVFSERSQHFRKQNLENFCTSSKSYVTFRTFGGRCLLGMTCIPAFPERKIYVGREKYSLPQQQTKT